MAAISVEDGIDKGTYSAGTYSAGAFGFGERPEEAVGCDIEEGCDAARIRPTDLYCDQHDRFLPFSRMSGAGKIFVVALVAFLVYGSVELTAQLDSAVPVNLGYILVGLGAIALPLRNFRRTCWVTAALWLAISGLALVFPLTDAHFHAVAAAAFLLVVHDRDDVGLDGLCRSSRRRRGRHRVWPRRTPAPRRHGRSGDRLCEPAG